MAFHKEHKAEGTLLVTKVLALALCLSRALRAQAAAGWLPHVSPVPLARIQHGSQSLRQGAAF